MAPKLLPQRGTWGGIIILGKGCISKNGGTDNIEGLAATSFGGGTSCDNADNSGVLQYVRVWYGGTDLDPTANNGQGSGNEINGITFGAVGSGTTVSQILPLLSYECIVPL